MFCIDFSDIFLFFYIDRVGKWVDKLKFHVLSNFDKIKDECFLQFEINAKIIKKFWILFENWSVLDQNLFELVKLTQVKVINNLSCFTLRHSPNLNPFSTPAS